MPPSFLAKRGEKLLPWAAGSPYYARHHSSSCTLPCPQAGQLPHDVCVLRAAPTKGSPLTAVVCVPQLKPGRCVSGFHLQEALSCLLAALSCEAIPASKTCSGCLPFTYNSAASACWQHCPATKRC